MPPRKPGKAAARERKPAMKRGGRVSTKPSGGSVKAATGDGELVAELAARCAGVSWAALSFFERGQSASVEVGVDGTGE